MHIGLTGTNAAGKTSIVAHLVAKGYCAYSLSDILRGELTNRQLSITRANLIQLGNELRQQFGPAVLAERTLTQLKTNYSVIDSIRNPAEIQALRQLKKFVLIGIDAPVEIRFQRAQARMRQENATTLAEFQHMEALEQTTDPNAQNIAACLQLADYLISNDQALDSLLTRVDQILVRVQSRLRPDWDEYFLKMAYLVAERSTCSRRHIGAIIVKEKQVLSTGYNGAARNIRDCLERGCLRDELKIPSGERHEICRGIHAEQNAIIQAARHGVNINHGTIYCTHSPCTICAKMIVNAGIERIVVCGEYPDILNMAQELYQEAQVRFDRIPMPDMTIRMLK